MAKNNITTLETPLFADIVPARKARTDLDNDVYNMGHEIEIMAYTHDMSPIQMALRLLWEVVR